MKRTIHLSVSIFLILLFSHACKKNTTDSTQSSSNLTLIRSAKQFFEDQVLHSSKTNFGNERLTASKSPDWSAAEVLQLSIGPAVSVLVHYKNKLLVKTNFSGEKFLNLNEITHLIIYKDLHSAYHAELITAFPDSNAVRQPAKNFTGILFVEDWAGNRIRQFKYNTGGRILSYNIQAYLNGKSSKVSSISVTQVKPATFIAICYEISGYNYSADDPDEGEYWSEPAGCDYLYFDGGGGESGGGTPSGGDYRSVGGGGGSGGNGASTQQITILTGPNIIGNIQDYLKCFTNVGGSDHIYNVTLCVDQPIPGTRQSWGFADGPSGTSATSNPFDVGHTFLIFSESYGGTTITRNVGLYPRTAVNPLYPSDQGQLNNNESSSYNISLATTVDNAQFYNMMNYVSQGNDAGYLYNLNTNNCTTFALAALRAGGVNISTQTGTWLNGSGYDPGDLGEDIRNMALSPNMSRNTVENPHPNAGQCY